MQYQSTPAGGDYATSSSGISSSSFFGQDQINDARKLTLTIRYMLLLHGGFALAEIATPRHAQQLLERPQGPPSELCVLECGLLKSFLLII